MFLLYPRAVKSSKSEQSHYYLPPTEELTISAVSGDLNLSALSVKTN